MMKISKLVMSLLVGGCCIFTFFIGGDSAQAASPINGEAIFKMNCAACHANGGNIVKPTRTLSKKDREKSGLKTNKDLVKYMRSPDEEMPTFDENKLPENEAKAVADYIIKTFK